MLILSLVILKTKSSAFVGADKGDAGTPKVRRKFQYQFKDGAVYDGTWLDAKFDGVGKHVFADKVNSLPLNVFLSDADGLCRVYMKANGRKASSMDRVKCSGSQETYTKANGLRINHMARAH